jgi:hypothetical protein
MRWPGAYAEAVYETVVVARAPQVACQYGVLYPRAAKRAPASIFLYLKRYCSSRSIHRSDGSGM